PIGSGLAARQVRGGDRPRTGRVPPRRADRPKEHRGPGVLPIRGIRGICGCDAQVAEGRGDPMSDAESRRTVRWQRLDRPGAERGGKKKDEEKEEPKAPRGPKKLEGVKEDFRYIVRMANTDLDGTRSVSYSLTAIPGVGIRVSEAVADLAGVPRTERLGNLSE